MVKVFVLPTQEDIVELAEGRRPANVLERDFPSEEALVAYRQGIEVIEDEFEELGGLQVVGTEVWLSRESESDESLGFASEAEALACRQGIEDAEGFRAPQVISPEDEDYVPLLRLLGLEVPTMYYIWHDEGCCDNSTSDLQEARDIAQELRVAGHVGVYITDDANRVVEPLALEEVC